MTHRRPFELAAVRKRMALTWVIARIVTLVAYYAFCSASIELADVRGMCPLNYVTDVAHVSLSLYLF